MRLLLLFLSLSRGERCSRAVLRTTPASYSDPDLPVLIDLHDVLIRDTSVLVFCPDAESRRAIKAVDGKLTPRMLRVTERGGPQLQLRVVDAAMPRAAADACDARAHYIASIGSFRLGASTWSNLWHGLTELVAIAGHVLTSVGCEAARCFEPSARKVLYVHSSAEQDAASGVPRDANPILRLLLGRAIFGEGNTFALRRRGGLLGRDAAARGRAGSAGRCVAALHFGAQTKVLTPLKSARPFTEERRVVVDAVVRAGWRTCGLPVDRDGPTVRLGNASSAVALPPRPHARATPSAVFVARSRQGGRHLGARAYDALAAAFRSAGVELRHCCEWSTMSACEQVALFASAGIVVGMHGAGLTNIAFTPRGSVLVELKGWYKNENDLFRKVVQARWGGYVGVNTEPGEDGATLQPASAWDRVAACALAVWRGRDPLAPDAEGGAFELCHNASARRGVGSVDGSRGPKKFGLLGAAARGHDVDCAAGGGAQRATCFRALGLPESDERGYRGPAQAGKLGNVKTKSARRLALATKQNRGQVRDSGAPTSAELLARLNLAREPADNATLPFAAERRVARVRLVTALRASDAHKTAAEILRAPCITATIAPLCAHLSELDARGGGGGTTRLFGDAIVVRDQCAAVAGGPWAKRQPVLASPGCGGGSTGNTLGYYWAARAIAASRGRALVWLRTCPAELDSNIEPWLPDYVPAPSSPPAKEDEATRARDPAGSRWSFAPFVRDGGAPGARGGASVSAALCAGRPRWMHAKAGPWLGILPRAREELAAGLAAAERASAAAVTVAKPSEPPLALAASAAIDDVAVHIRAGDALEIGLAQYGLARAADLARDIVELAAASSTTADTITVGLVSRGFATCAPAEERAAARCGVRPARGGPTPHKCCDCASAALLPMLRGALERALLNASAASPAPAARRLVWRVEVRDADAPLGAMVRVALAPVASFCLSSTFCLWPVLAAPRGRWPAESAGAAAAARSPLRAGADHGALLFAGARAAEALLTPGFAVLEATRLVPYASIHAHGAFTCKSADVAKRLVATGVIDREAPRGAHA